VKADALMIISRSVLLRMRNASGKSCLEIQNRNFTLNAPPLDFCSIYEIMWKNVVKLGRPQMTI
jgi:hypothetical protein